MFYGKNPQTVRIEIKAVKNFNTLRELVLNKYKKGAGETHHSPLCYALSVFPSGGFVCP